MKRAARVYLNSLNDGKADVVRHFLHQCHNVTQYFVDLFWQRQDYSGKLADLPTVHKGRERFGITTRLAQALAKQAKECIRSQRQKRQRKPRLRSHVVTLYYHFVTIEKFVGAGFDWAVKLIGSGAPRLTIPVASTKPILQRLADGWQMSKTIRLGMRKDGRLWVDFIFEKERLQLKDTGRVVGMDSNYKAGLVFSDDQVVGEELYPLIQGFNKRQKHTRAEIKSVLGKALKRIDFSQVKMLVIEDLKKVKHGKRGTFSRGLTGGCLIGFMPMLSVCWSENARNWGFSWRGKIPVILRSSVLAATNGIDEAEKVTGLSVYIVATLPMLTIMQRTTWSF